jgi:hypothetical protein
MKNFKTYGQFIAEAYSDEERKELADKGFALSDGSFPIKDLKDLKNAIQAYGRAKDQARAAKFIVKRAKALGAEDLIPDTEDFQKSLGESKLTEAKDDYTARYKDTNINLKKGYKHLNDEELNQLYLEIGELISANKLKVKDATLQFESSVNEKLARGLKPLLTIGSTITKNAGEDALLDLSDKFDRIDDEYAGDIASWLDMAIELMQDGYSGDATKKLKQFNKACKDVLGGKEIGSAFESVNEANDQDRLTYFRKFGIAPNNQPQNAAYIKQVLKPGKFFVDWKDAFELGDVALEFVKQVTSISEFDIIDLKTMKRTGKQLDVKKGQLGNLRTTYGVRVNESYEGDFSDFKYDMEMAVDNIGISPKAIKKVSKKGKGYEVRMSSYMSNEETWKKLGDSFGAKLISFTPGSINIGIYE